MLSCCSDPTLAMFLSAPQPGVWFIGQNFASRSQGGKWLYMSLHGNICRGKLKARWHLWSCSWMPHPSSWSWGDWLVLMGWGGHPTPCSPSCFPCDVQSRSYRKDLKATKLSLFNPFWVVIFHSSVKDTTTSEALRKIVLITVFTCPFGKLRKREKESSSWFSFISVAGFIWTIHQDVSHQQHHFSWNRRVTISLENS